MSFRCSVESRRLIRPAHSKFKGIIRTTGKGTANEVYAKRARTTARDDCWALENVLKQRNRQESKLSFEGTIIKIEINKRKETTKFT